MHGRGSGIPQIRAAEESERRRAIGTVTVGFVADPLARWLLPEPSGYLAEFPSIVDAFGGSGLAHGATYVADDFGGAAFWLPPGVRPDTARLLECFRRNAGRAVLADLLGVYEQMEAYHPHLPHWYLPLIGVDPMQQGRGLGALLMRHALLRCDADRVVAYLESTNPRNISLYQRHGFEILGTIQVGGSPPITPMVRYPR
jgi:GNAT superfamily N-acetyltransferase